MTTIKAALVVQNCLAGNYEKNLNSTREFIGLALEKGARLIVFPEMNLTGYVSNHDIHSIARPVTEEMLTLFQNLAGESKASILVGWAEKSPDKAIYASHFIFHPDGTSGVYRKIHTSPFEKKYFSLGNKIPVFNSNGLIFGVQLCYDAHFPELSLAMALKQADVIFIPHASPRGSSREKYDSWVRHLRARAFDNGVYIAALNQTGDNGKGLSFPGICLFIGPDGHVVYKSVEDGEGVHIISIEKKILDDVRSHPMRYFLPNRRKDLFP
nr:amidohydrolase [Desulfobacula sp.]